MVRRTPVLLVVLLFAWQWTAAACGQVYHLPPVMPLNQAIPERQLEFYPAPDGGVLMPGTPFVPEESPADPALGPSMPFALQSGAGPPELPLAVPPPDPDRPPDARDGMFQKLTFQSTWLGGGSGDDAFGMTDLELKTVLALPIPSRKFPLIVTPGFTTHYLDGPRVSDLPPRVYDAYVQFRWFRRFTPRLATDLAVTPGVYSDFEYSRDDALRITGHAAAVYDWTPTTRLVLGVAYLDREDIGVLPIGGVIWKPNDQWEFKLVAPRPEIARRVYWFGQYGEQVKDWLYVAGEFGGGTWAIERADGRPDTFTYRDFRALLGLERKAIGNLDAWIEVGYVFGREIEYDSRTPDVSPSDTFLLRAGVTY
jgi:hypothetical protein